MPDLQRVVSDMLAKGASLDDVRSTLSEMGVGDEKIEELLARNEDAKAQQAPEELLPAQQPAPAAKRKAAQQAPEEMSLLDLGLGHEGAALGTEEANTAAGADGAALTEINKKLEEILAAVKGIQELDRKLLEANRDLALKIKTSQ